MEVASLTAFRYHPEKFFDWLRPLASQIWAAQPNPAHLALARLEQAGYLRAVITQNIDGLHQRSGSTEVIEVHGSVSTLICPHCHSVFPAEEYANPFVTAGVLPHCTNCQTLLKPAITLFEEMLPMDAWDRAVGHSRQAGCYLVIGSSLEVSPANDLPRLALNNGAKLIIITLSPTYLDRRADVIIRGDAAVLLPEIVDLVLNQSNKESI
jgi:NAD-dependent deacetylase